MIERERGKAEGRSAGKGSGAITADVHLELERDVTKYRVEAFDVTIENAGTSPLTVDRIRLTFDGEEKMVPMRPVDIDPGETETIDVRWDRIYPDQETLTVEPQSGDETVASIDVSLDLDAYA